MVLFSPIKSWKVAFFAKNKVCCLSKRDKVKHETHRQRKPTIKSGTFASRFDNENKNAQRGTDSAFFLTPLSNLSSLTRVDLLARITKNYPSSVFASEKGVSALPCFLVRKIQPISAAGLFSWYLMRKREGVSKSLKTPTCKNANLSIYGFT